MTIQEKAEAYNKQITNDIAKSDALRNAYLTGANDIIHRVKHWFEHEGPFVFPEDDDTLNDLLQKLKMDL